LKETMHRRTLNSLGLLVIALTSIAVKGDPSSVPFNFPDSMITVALGIGPDGDVVGSYKNSSGVVHGYLWSKGSLFLRY
jgi:hypothetical protein